MSFASRETSLASGRPVRLYLFERGGLRWGYGSADRDVTFQSVIYRSRAVSDDGLRLTGETSADAVTVKGPADLEVAQLYRAAPPSAEVWLTIRDYHDGEPDVAGSALVSWIGSVTGVTWPEAGRSEIRCQSLSASLDRPGLRLTWQRPCPHSLYDRNCKVDRNLFKVAATVLTVDGAGISAAAFATQPDGYFAGGFVEWNIGGGELERRGIESHVGSNVALLGSTAGLAIGQQIVGFAGCPQTAEVCNGRFNNLLNYGGALHLPGKSPFDGNPIF